MTLDIKKCCLVVIDVQGKLAQLMHEKEQLFQNIQTLITSANILDIPILWCQQNPNALGPTVPSIAKLLDKIEPIDKFCFSCCSHDQFNARLKQINRQQLILCGIEAHICVYQTAIDLIDQKKSVTVVADAISSRTPANKKIAINRMGAEGVKISSTEMTLFELLKTAKHPKFKLITKLIK